MLRSTVVMEWEAAGSLRTTREKILRLLRVRTRQEVPEDLVQRIEAEEKLTLLDQWFDHAATVSSIEEMRAGMPTPQS